MLRALAHALACLAAPASAFPVERCMNLGTAMEAPVEGDWGYVIQQRYLTAIAEAGFDTIRLPVRFSAHWDGEHLSPQILARTDQVIGWAEAAGLNVILDLHHFEEFETDPAAHMDDLRKIWAELGRHFAGHADTLMFEIFNEPSGAFTTEIAAPLFARIVAELRGQHPTRWIITSGGGWGNIDEMLRLPPPDPFEVRSFHYYDPYEFTHQQAWWMSDAPPARGWGSAEDHATLTTAIARAASGPRPLFLGEFGVYAGAPDRDRLDWIRSVRRAAEDHGIGWCYWGFSQGIYEGFSAYDTGTDTWEAPVLDALLSEPPT
jgi:endoglucanase